MLPAGVVDDVAVVDSRASRRCVAGCHTPNWRLRKQFRRVGAFVTLQRIHDLKATRIYSLTLQPLLLTALRTPHGEAAPDACNCSPHKQVEVDETAKDEEHGEGQAEDVLTAKIETESNRSQKKP
jgi:hypothetical protein